MDKKLSFVADKDLVRRLEAFARTLPPATGGGRPSLLSEAIREALRSFFGADGRYTTLNLAESERALILALRRLDKVSPELGDALLTLAEFAASDRGSSEAVLGFSRMVTGLQQRASAPEPERRVLSRSTRPRRPA